MSIDEKFVNAVKAMENRTRRVKAFVVINPAFPKEHFGRIVIGCPADGAGRLYSVAWLPWLNEAKELTTKRHHGHANGGGYDKATAAMGGGEFWNLKTGTFDKLADQGYDFRRQLEDAGYLVIQAC